MRPRLRAQPPPSDPQQEYLASRGLLVELETPRIRLRYVCLADVPRLFALFQDAEVTRFFTWRPPRDEAETEDYVAGFQHEILQHSAYHFSILVRPADQVIGVGNLYHIHRARAEAEIGIWLGRPYWGRRYQADVNRLLIRFAQEELGLRRILFRVAAENTRARRAFERLGASLTDRVWLYSYCRQQPIEHLVYAIETSLGASSG
jgi:[ribosomal protein S5]-alanine N-acetyltransferase